MKISEDKIVKTCPESEIYQELLELDDKYILELGCGAAELTRTIATEGRNRQIMATEVDVIQHNKNILLPELNNVTFQLAGAEAIPVSDNTFDVVFMFKSLHHVPVKLMRQALTEVQRVLKPNGIAYISEPIFAGNFNNVLRLFHDEEIVRREAFLALNNAVDTGVFALISETFFNLPLTFENFADFENKVLKSTHIEHNLPDNIYKQVEELFSKQESGKFTVPIRVDLLQPLPLREVNMKAPH